MAEHYLQLPAEDRLAAYYMASAELGRGPRLLEKDLWVCWAIQILFEIPSPKRMAFKGGTSLSKVYQAIHRFSEDVDITIDYRDLAPGLDLSGEHTTRSRLKRYSERLRQELRAYTGEVVVPFLEYKIKESVGEQATVEVDRTGEMIRIRYQSAMPEQALYLSDSVLIELGGRNVTEPGGIFEVSPDMAPYFPDVLFPSARAHVLSAVRTFWEKATLIHAACRREEREREPERLARHWYDLSMLAGGDIGGQALASWRILEDVVRVKKAFFYAPYARYDECLEGGMRLVPSEPYAEALRRDYDHMVAAGMFYGEPPDDFAGILKRLAALQDEINRRQNS
jgi:hypothetical protein